MNGISEPIHVLIVDDIAKTRKLIRDALETQPDVVVVQEALDGITAVQLADELQPDAVLMDIRLKNSQINGIEATRQIGDMNPLIAVVMLTNFADDESVFEAIKAGARGYVLKQEGPEVMLRALRAAAHGEFLCSPTIARRIMMFFERFPRQSPNVPTIQSPYLSGFGLTNTEHKVLHLIAQGKSNDEIAQHFDRARKTIETHVSSIYLKLHAANRADAIIKAQRAGYG